jgi:DNA polymerase-4
MDNTVSWLFLDLNAYFASVEQQVRPALRGQPVAVVPTLTDSSCCIAVSYEAKAYGIRTGTLIAEAKKLCPRLHLVEAVPMLYVRYHHQIVQAVESCVPVDSVLSIDEMICRLTGSQRAVPNATALAQKIKQTLAREVGECLRCSIGLAPNRYLAKVASEMQKPDSLTVLCLADLPRALYGLELTDLPGIGSRMEARLHERSLFTVEQLCALSARQMHEIWGGVVGERLRAWLHGEEVEEPETHRSSVGHSHVLPPELRTPHGAYQVVRKLTCKAAVRLRRMGYWAKGVSLAVQFIAQGDWADQSKVIESQDTPTLLKAVEKLWSCVPAGKPLWVGVTFFPLVSSRQHTPSLFENPKQEKLSLVMDQINEKYGHDTAFFGDLPDRQESAPTRVSYTQIPDLKDF